MTNREFYTKVMATCENEELVEFAKLAIEKLDTKNAKRVGVPSKTTMENVALRENIMGILKASENPMTATEIAQVTGLSIQKVGSLITGKNGINNVVITKVKSASGKGKVNAYSLA